MEVGADSEVATPSGKLSQTSVFMTDMNFIQTIYRTASGVYFILRSFMSTFTELNTEKKSINQRVNKRK